MKRFVLIYLLVTSIAMSCSDNTATISDFIFETCPDLAEVEAVLIIPGVGCEGCIGNATQFALDYADSLNLGIVFTKVVSLKTLKFRLGNDFFELPNVKIDTFDLCPLDETFYPSIFYPNTRRFIVVSPENPNTLEDLKNLR